MAINEFYFFGGTLLEDALNICKYFRSLAFFFAEVKSFHPIFAVLLTNAA
jgi:hypothetical protein